MFPPPKGSHKVDLEVWQVMAGAAPNKETGYYSVNGAARILGVEAQQIEDWLEVGALKSLSAVDIALAYLEPPRRGKLTKTRNPWTGELVITFK